MEVKKYLKEGDKIPKGWGIAYVEIPTYKVAIYPIPLNIIVSLMRRIRRWFMYGHKLYYDAEKKGYENGFEEGRKYAFNQYKLQVLQYEMKNIVDNFFTYFLEVLRLPEEKQYGWMSKFIDKEIKRIQKSKLK